MENLGPAGAAEVADLEVPAKPYVDGNAGGTNQEGGHRNDSLPAGDNKSEGSTHTPTPDSEGGAMPSSSYATKDGGLTYPGGAI